MVFGWPLPFLVTAHILFFTLGEASSACAGGEHGQIAEMEREGEEGKIP